MFGSSTFWRKKYNYFTFTVLAFIIFGFSGVRAEHKIMPLGNSITRGMGGDAPYDGYRKELYQLLNNGGWEFDFVGSMSDGTFSDPEHEGHGGWKAQDIDANISDWMSTYNPNIVLLHIGTNDISAEEPNSQTINEIESILDKIFAYNSTATMFLCKLIPRLEQPGEEHIRTEELNVLIEQLYTEKKQEEGYNIYLVDQNSAFKANENWRTEYMIDNVHPNSEGYSVIANTYFTSMNAATYPQFTLTLLVNPEGAGNVYKSPDKETYTDHELVEIRAEALGSYNFDHWSGDIDITTSNPRNIYMIRDRTIIANFIDESQEYVSVPDRPTGPTSAETGEELSFSTGGSTSSEGHDVEYQFDWGDGGQSVWGSATQKHIYGGSGTYQVRARARCTIHTTSMSSWSDALDVSISGDAAYVLTTLVNPPSAGTVSVSPDKEFYEQNETVTLTAVPASGEYDFEFWSGDIDTNYSNPVTIFMVRSRTIIANFSGGSTSHTLTISVDPAGVGYVDKDPDQLSYQYGEYVDLTAHSYTGEGAVDKIYVEGESGAIGGAMDIDFDTEASGDQYIYSTSSVPKSGYADYTFEVQEAGTFVAWGRCYALSGTEDSFFFVLDGSPDTLTWHLNTSYGIWKWQKVSDWYSIQEFYLSEGTHTFSIVSRDVNSRLDKVIFSKDPDFVPVGEENPSQEIYVFDHWSGDLSGSSNPETIFINGNKNVTAHFSQSDEFVTTPFTPTGPSSGTVGQNLSFSTGGSSSALGNPVEYQFDFGDGTLSSWGGTTRTNTFTQPGTYEVRSRARSQVVTAAVSAWSGSHIVTISDFVPNILTVNIVPEGAGTVDRDPYRSGYEQNEWVQLTAVPKESDSNIRIEAESGTLYGSATIGFDQEAASGQYIYGSSSVPKSGRVEYEFQVQETGTYYIWGRCFALSTTEDSFFMVVDGSGDTLTWHLDTDYNVWKWQKVSHDFSVQSFQLNAGWHSLSAITRDVNSRLDNIIITNDPAFVPVGTEERSQIAKFEAESGTLTGPIAIGNDTQASGDQYIYATSAVPMSAKADFTFNIESPGVYYVWGRCYALSGTEDSFFIQFDEGQTLTWHLDTEYHVWKWQRISHNYVEQEFNFSQGEHTVALISRDVNSRIDKLFMTTNVNYIPTGKEDAPISRDVIYRFDHWEGDLTGNSNPVDLLMDGDKTVFAHFVEAEETVTPPTDLMGPETGIIGQSIGFMASGASTSLGNDVDYQFSWGDGSVSSWNGDTREHVFSSSGVFLVKARARSVVDTTSVSSWSDPHQVTISGFTLTVSVEPDSGGNVEYTPVKTEYSLGETVTFTATPSAGFAFDHWTGDLSGNTNPTQLVMSSNKSVTAVFSTTTETVSKPTYLNGPANGVMGQNLEFSTGGSVSNLGHELEYQFDWGDGTFSSWGESTGSHIYSISGVIQVKSKARCKLHPSVVSDWSDPHTVSVTGYLLTVVINPSGYGVVTKNPDKTKYGYGEKVALSAVALEGYKFENWSGDMSGNVNPDTLVMIGDKHVIANFSQTQEIVSPPTFVTGIDSGFVGTTINFTTGGSLSNLGSQIEYQYDWGDGTLSVWGDSTGSHIYNITGTIRVKARGRSMVDIGVVSDWSDPHTIVISHEFFHLNIVIDPVGAGSVNRTPFKSEYREGEYVFLSPLPVSGYIFDRWSGDLTGIDNPAYISIDSDKNIMAHFRVISKVNEETENLPETFELSQNYPNPFNPETTIQYQLAKDCQVRISIYNIQGQKIGTIVDEFQPVGYYSRIWHAVDMAGNRLPSGVYVYRIDTEYFSQFRKMILMK